MRLFKSLSACRSIVSKPQTCTSGYSAILPDALSGYSAPLSAQIFMGPSQRIMADGLTLCLRRGPPAWDCPSPATSRCCETRGWDHCPVLRQRWDTRVWDHLLIMELIHGQKLGSPGVCWWGIGLMVSSMAWLCFLYPRGTVMQVVASLPRHLKPY